MPQAAVAVLGVGLTAVVLLSDIRRAFLVTVGTMFLVPGTLVVPNVASNYPAVVRLVSLALLVNVLIGVWSGRYPRRALRLRRVHAVLVLLIAISIVNGVALAIPLVSTGDAFLSFGLVVDQLLFLMAVLGAVRLIDDPAFVLRVVAGFVVAAAGVAAWEWVTDRSWTNIFFSDLASQRRAQVVRTVELRGGELQRVHGAAGFALEFGWLLAVSFPLVLARAARTRLPYAAAPIIVALAVYWTNARSAVAALAVGGLVVVVLSRLDLRLTRLVALGAIAAILVMIAVPNVQRSFTIAEQSKSVDVRVERLKVAAEIAAERPYRGLGLGGLNESGVPAIDTSFMIVYSELGVLGLVAFFFALLWGVGSTFGGLRAPPGLDRTVAAGAATGALLGIGATGAYALFSLPGSLRLFWLMVAIGIWMGERHPDARGVAWKPHWKARAALPVVGLLGGLIISAAVVAPMAVAFRFHVLPESRVDDYRGATMVFFDEALLESACDVAEAQGDSADRVECRRLQERKDVGHVRIEGSNEDDVAAMTSRVIKRLSSDFPGFEVHPSAGLEPVEAKPTWARTAPVWLAVVGALLAGFWPPLSLRRVRTWHPEMPLDEALGSVPPHA